MLSSFIVVRAVIIQFEPLKFYTTAYPMLKVYFEIFIDLQAKNYKRALERTGETE